MWVCPKCHEEVEDNFESCWSCQTERGDTSQAAPNKKAVTEDISDDSYSDNEFEDRENGGFFSFRTMVSRTLIQIIYIFGALGLSIYGVMLIVNSLNRNSGSLFVTGLGILLLGNLVWRIICEAWILLFNIHDVLVSIERKI